MKFSFLPNDTGNSPNPNYVPPASKTYINSQHYRQSLEEELQFHREAGNDGIVMGLEVAVAALADEPAADNVIILPCAPGSTVYEMDELRKNCPMRHPDNGNCLPVGGFCTAVSDLICKALHNAYGCGWYTLYSEVFNKNVVHYSDGKDRA